MTWHFFAAKTAFFVEFPARFRLAPRGRRSALSSDNAQPEDYLAFRDNISAQFTVNQYKMSCAEN